MSIQTGPVFLQGRYGNISAYYCSGQWRFRKVSSLTGKRVKTSPRFRNTMLFAGLLGRASAIGSAIYAALPPHWKQYWMYRSFVGEAMTMIKEGKTDEEALLVLWNRYAAEFATGYAEEKDFQHIALHIPRIAPKHPVRLHTPRLRPFAQLPARRQKVISKHGRYEELLL